MSGQGHSFSPLIITLHRIHGLLIIFFVIYVSYSKHPPVAVALNIPKYSCSFCMKWYGQCLCATSIENVTIPVNIIEIFFYDFQFSQYKLLLSFPYAPIVCIQPAVATPAINIVCLSLSVLFVLFTNGQLMAWCCPVSDGNALLWRRAICANVGLGQFDD